MSKNKHEAFDPESYDEVDCPRCAGGGQQGMTGDICSVCDGMGVVSSANYDAYTRHYG